MDKGIVKKILSKNTVEIVITSPGDCETCSAKGACGGFKAPKGEERIIKALTKDNLSEGDKVVIEIDPSYRIKLSFMLFLFPVICVFLSYIIFDKLFNIEIVSITASFIFAFISIFGIIFFMSKSIYFKKIHCRARKY